MPFYRKKPVVIEAVKCDYEPGENFHITFVGCTAHWLQTALATPPEKLGSIFPHGYGRLVIRTLEGLMEIAPGDFIIRGVKGEIYPCKPDIFELTYDEVGCAAS